jgi:hypothetical protein
MTKFNSILCVIGMALSASAVMIFLDPTPIIQGGLIAVVVMLSVYLGLTARS